MSNKKFPDPIQYKPKNPAKYIGNPNAIWSRSSWETKFMIYLDKNPNVLYWNSEDIKIKYYSTTDQKIRTYHMDFLLKYKHQDGSIKTLLVEIKPYAQTVPPKKGRRKKIETYLNEEKTFRVNQDKWTAAEAWAKKHGCDFQVITEYELYPEYARKGRPIEKPKKTRKKKVV